MATMTFPFSREDKVDNSETRLLQSDVYEMLSLPLKKATEANPHLLGYLSMLPISQIGVPSYYLELSRKMSDIKEPNLIYPTKREGIFIHILVDHDDNRNRYIPVEPTLTMDIDSLMREIDIKLLDLRGNLVRIDPKGNREQQLMQCLDKVITLDDHKVSLLARIIGRLRKDGSSLVKIKVNKLELRGIQYQAIRDKIGLSVLEALIADPYIEDISCSGVGQVFVEHKIFNSLKSALTFPSMEELDEYVLWLAEQLRKPVTFRNPIIDATLPDGSRINIVYGSDVSRRGSNFSIRKFSGVPTSIFELVDFGSLNYQMLAYLSLAIGNGMNLFVSGETASGKTTLLNAITAFIHPLAKIVSIEDTPELQVPHSNWIREVVQTAKSTTGSGITMFDLLMAALRQRPDEIIIGEIRGEEGNVAFQAMQTGHSVMATFHAATVEKLIQRLSGSPILVPKTYIDNLNIVIFTSMVKLPNGKQSRRVTSINEIVGYDPAHDSFTFIESFHWNEEKDTFEFPGFMTSFILEQKIASLMGIPSGKKQRIYAELERRAKILSRLHKEQGVTDFYEVLEVLSKAQREGLF